MSAESGAQKSTSVKAALDYAVATHIGQRREENQDSFGFLLNDGFACFVVADGMGGASGGAQASAMAVRTLEDRMSRNTSEVMIERVRDAVLRANQEIFKKGKANPSLEGMGTTLSGFVITLEGLLLFNVGDSRVYRIRGNTITQLSNDHTLVSELLNTGALTQEQASRSPVSHMLTRSVGPAAMVEVDCQYLDEPPRADDIYLICSDGLYNTISSAEIGYVVGEYRLNDALEHLVALANMRGGADNITGILVECGTQFPRSEMVTTAEDSAEEAAQATRRNIVHIDLAEAAAADTFSKVKKEVDISAEILWGAHKDNRRAAKLEKDEITTDPLVSRPPIDTISQRALMLFGLVFCSAMVAAVWINHLDSQASPAPYVSTYRKDQMILDLSNGREVRKESLVDRQDAEEQSSRRRELTARLQRSAPELSAANQFEVRRARLQRSRDRLKAQLESIDKPIEPEVLQNQKDLEIRRAEIGDKVHAVDLEIEKLDRQLVQWRRRLQDIEEIDTVNLASELAPFSEVIARGKAEFEQITWRYLRELEGQRIDPSNQEIRARVEGLIGERNLKLSELAQLSRGVIEGMIARDSREQGLLLIQQDVLREDEREILAEVEYMRVRLNGSIEDRSTLSATLRRQLEILERQLQEMLSPAESQTSASYSSMQHSASGAPTSL